MNTLATTVVMRITRSTSGTMIAMLPETGRDREEEEGGERVS